MANKRDIVECVASSTGLTKKDAVDAVDAVFDCITDHLSGPGDRVQIPGFGTFIVGHRAARSGINPQTKKPITIAASNNVRFKAGKALKDAVN